MENYKSILDGCSEIFTNTYILYCKYLNLKIESKNNLSRFIEDIYKKFDNNIEIFYIDIDSGRIDFYLDDGRYSINYKKFNFIGIELFKQKIEKLIENENKSN